VGGHRSWLEAGSDRLAPGLGASSSASTNAAGGLGRRKRPFGQGGVVAHRTSHPLETASLPADRDDRMIGSHVASPGSRGPVTLVRLSCPVGSAQALGRAGVVRRQDDEVRVPLAELPHER